ncbi:DUF1707 domain-containing protein [Streptosporangium sp. 'caverna']|uniref:DUF1707 SHOCT-like domain-containing protein n=1 Tax=Streptosporangium sp. 'caverna' TaxID=2202249 RepID=UPI000D7E785E|nr:DUF1707 domain-containing protein [Streptosporangium sp. 'caverna']AWS48155.1 hypothetical protein DKM19_03720 [Streptosporangium sp. 'caverna']
MAAGPNTRASDGDRDKVASVLREHYAQGRLTVEEFDERLEQLYTSRTYGELATLTSDLPDVDLQGLSNASSRLSERGGRPGGVQASHGALRSIWAVWAVASGVNWMVWFIVGATDGFDFPYPWPLWVMGPWGVMLLLTTVVTGRGRDRNP